MTAELKGVQLQIDADPRLAAAAGGAARFIAEAAGVAPSAVAELQKSIVAACEKAFDQLTNDRQHVDVTIARFPDRIEVTLSCEGTPGRATRVTKYLGHTPHIV